MLVVLSPLLAVIATLVVLDSKGPALFCQRRLGRFGRPIRCLKFRSMYADAEAKLLADPVLYRQYVEHDYKLPAATDTRITRIGHFLRRTSLDELPQLWNVIRGDMSLVGPRPTSFAAGTYDTWQTGRLDFRPGVTGPWQVEGRTSMDFEERCRLEITFFRNPSFWREIRLIFATVREVFRRTGVA